MVYCRNRGLILTLLLLATTLVYINGLNNPFVPDDRFIIFDNFGPRQSWTPSDLFRRSLFGTTPSETAYFRPLTLLTFALNYPFAGKNPQGYRLVNVATHLLVVVLMTFLFSRLTGQWVAAFATLLFALHPAHVQAVSYISSRSDPLYSALALLCLLFWHKGNKAQGRRRLYYLGSALFTFFLGLFAKETMIVVPPLAVVMDLTWNETGSWRIKIGRNRAWYFGFLLLFAIYLIIRVGVGFSLTMEGDIKIALWSRLFLASKLFFLYLALAFYPVHLALFRTVVVPQTFFEWQVMAGAFLLVALAALAYLFWSTHREISFGVLWFLISLLPVLSLTLLNAPMMEHWLYLPLIGLMLAFVAAVRILAERVGEVRGAAIGLILLALLLSARTIMRNAEWSNMVRLLSHNALSYPGYFKTWQWLGDAMRRKGMVNDAIRAYKTSLALKPNQLQSLVALGEVLSLAGRNNEAEAVLSQVVSKQPRQGWFHYLLGMHRLKVGKNRQAVEALEKSIGLNPSAMAYHGLGSAYLRTGQTQKGERAFQKAILIHQGESGFHAEFHLDLGKLYLAEGKNQEAQEEWRIALRFEPNHAEARTLLEKPAKE